MFVIKGKYGNEPIENIDEFDTEEEANVMLSEYKMAYGQGWSLWIEGK